MSNSGNLLPQTDEAVRAFLTENLDAIDLPYTIDEVSLTKEGFAWLITVKEQQMKGRCLWGTEGKILLQFMLAMAIGTHPMGQYLTYCMEAARFDTSLKLEGHEGLKRHPIQILMRVQLANWVNTYGPKRAREEMARLLAVEENVAMIYAQPVRNGEHDQKRHSGGNQS